MIKATTISYSWIVSRWPKIGRAMKPNFVTGEIDKIMVIFFSDKRSIKFPSLVHLPNKGIILSGKRGIGKSFVFEILRKLIQHNPNLNRPVIIKSVLQIEEEYKAAKDEKKSGEYLKELINTPELVIDDLGMEDTKFNDYGTIRNLIADIIFLRYPLYQRGLVITHGTTMLKHDDLPKIYPAHIVDRMREMFVFQRFSDQISKRENPPPVKFEREQDIKPVPKSPFMKRIEYLTFFQEQIKKEDDLPFYDKDEVGPGAWGVLVKMNKIDPNQLNNPDIIYKAQELQKKLEDNRRIAMNPVNFVEYQRYNSMEKEVLKLKKHLILKDFFTKNTLDFKNLTTSDLLL